MKVATTRSVDYLDEPGHDFWKRHCWWVTQMLFFWHFEHHKPCAVQFHWIRQKPYIPMSSWKNSTYSMNVLCSSFSCRRKRTSSGRSARWPTAKCCGGPWCRPPSCCQSVSGRWNDLKTSSLPRSWSDDDLWPLHLRPDNLIASLATPAMCKLYAKHFKHGIYDTINTNIDLKELFVYNMVTLTKTTQSMSPLYLFCSRGDSELWFLLFVY